MPLGRVEIGARAAALWRLYFASNSDTKRAEAEAAIAVLEARKAHSRLRDAIDICRKASYFLTQRVGTSYGTGNTPKSTAAAPICLSPASSLPTRFG